MAYASRFLSRSKQCLSKASPDCANTASNCGGLSPVNQSRDREEMAEIQKMHSLIEQYDLHGQFRWIAAQMNRARNGELYRYIADTKGVFVQPAFYEAFGLTVVESMTCGLPTFATCHGGPAEIIENGVSGYHIDPYHPDQVAATLVSFFESCNTNPNHWIKISEGGLKRIYERYTWKKYSREAANAGWSLCILETCVKTRKERNSTLPRDVLLSEVS